jgi:hypothetical protein
MLEMLTEHHLLLTVCLEREPEMKDPKKKKLLVLKPVDVKNLVVAGCCGEDRWQK